MRVASKRVLAGVRGAILSAVCAVGAVAGAQAAWAQNKPPAPWIKMTTTSGCVFFWYDYDDQTGSWMKESPWTWSGSCVNGVTSGAGVLSSPREGTMSSMQNGQLVQKSYTYTRGLRGTMVEGYFNGRVDQLTDGQMMADYMHSTYTMGCGQSASHARCVPHVAAASSSQRAAPAATVPLPTSLPAGSPASATRVSTDPAIVRSDIMSSSEDRVFAILGELVQTGRIDLAREARNALASRYPNSPLLPLAMQLVDSLVTGSQGQAAPGGSPPPPSLAAPGQLGIEDIRRMAEAEFGAAQDISGSSGSKVYQINLVSGGLNVPIALEVSASGKFVWLSAIVGSGNIAPDRAALALKRISKIGPTIIWDDAVKLRFGLPVENRALTQTIVKDAMERLANDIANNRDIWQ